MASSLRLALFGPPGAGKGTQAQLLKEQLDIAHLSSGDLFRYHLQQKTELGLQAAEYMNRGALVPDEVVIGIVLDKALEFAPEQGFILDGFPRTTDQAQALADALAEKSRGLDTVVYISVPEAELVRRLSGRFVCRQCQAPDNVAGAAAVNPPSCGQCGGELYQREDDRAEAVQQRIAVYRRETAPVLDFYRERGLLTEISGVGPVAAINRLTLAALNLSFADIDG